MSGGSFDNGEFDQSGEEDELVQVNYRVSERMTDILNYISGSTKTPYTSKSNAAASSIESMIMKVSTRLYETKYYVRFSEQFEKVVGNGYKIEPVKSPLSFGDSADDQITVHINKNVAGALTTTKQSSRLSKSQICRACNILALFELSENAPVFDSKPLMSEEIYSQFQNASSLNGDFEEKFDSYLDRWLSRKLPQTKHEMGRNFTSVRRFGLWYYSEFKGLTGYDQTVERIGTEEFDLLEELIEEYGGVTMNDGKIEQKRFGRDWDKEQ